MTVRRLHFRAHAWEPFTMTWAEVAEAVFRRNEAWLRANLPADFPRADPLYGLFHVEAVEAWARRRWQVVDDTTSPENAHATPRGGSRGKEQATLDTRHDRTGAAGSEPPNYRVSTLASRWDCSPNKIRGLIACGTLPCLRLGKLIRIPAAAVHAYEAEHQIKPGPSPAAAEAATSAASRDAIRLARADAAARRSQAQKES